MILNNTDDDDTETLYDGYTEADAEEKPKEPRYPRTDPRFWQQPESPWEHLRPRTSRRRLAVLIGAGIAAFLLLWAAYVWWFTPAVDDAVQYGYVEHVERRGYFKTYEGTLLPYKSMHDTTRALEPLFTFSASEKSGQTLRQLQNSGKPMRVEYRTYRTAVPWRGESRTVITRVDTVSPDSILPQRR